MANLNDICKNVVSDVSDALACGVVDLNTGMLMAVHHTVPYFTQTYLDAVAAAAVDMFRGKNITRVEQLIAKQRGIEPERTFEEIFISTKMSFHFMKVIEGKDALMVLVTKKTTNQGMGWSSLRMVIADVQSILP